MWVVEKKSFKFLMKEESVQFSFEFEMEIFIIFEICTQIEHKNFSLTRLKTIKLTHDNNISDISNLFQSSFS